MSYIRTYTFYVLVFFWTFFLSICSIFLLLSWEKSSYSYRRIMRIWCGGIVKILYFLGLRYRLKGYDTIPSGHAIYACKHHSWWETFALAYLLDDAVFVLKSSLLQIPIVGYYMRSAGMIGIDRMAGPRSLKTISSRCSSAISSGSSIVIFPEGRRVGIEEEVKIKRGILLLYKNCIAPVVPVALNSGVYWNKKSGLITKVGLITMEFLPAIESGLPDDVFLGNLQKSLSEASSRLVKESDKG